MNEDSRSISTLSTLALLIKIFAIAYIVLSLFPIGGLGYETFKGPDEIVVTAGGASPSFSIWPLIIITTSALLILAAVALIISALIWVYCAHTNLSRQGTEMDYKGRWAVASYFIPFVNMLVPYRAMRELHNRSHGAIPEHVHSGVEDVGAWWTAYLTGLLLWSGIVLRVLMEMFTNLFLTTPPWMDFILIVFAQSVIIVACFMLIKLTREITAAQAAGSHVWNAFE